MLYFKAFIYLFILSQHSARRILVPWTGIDPYPLQWKLEVLTTGHQGSPDKCQSVSQFSQSLSCVRLCDPMDCSTPGLPVHHQIPEFAQAHVHSVGDAIQPSHPLSSPSPPALNPSQHQGLFKWVSSSHQVAKVLEPQLQHQSFQWIFKVDFLYGWLVCSPCYSRDSQKSSPTPQFKSINS